MTENLSKGTTEKVFEKCERKRVITWLKETYQNEVGERQTTITLFQTTTMTTMMQL